MLAGIAAAKVRLDSIARDGSMRAFTDALDPRIVVVLRARDSLVGPAAVLAVLNALHMSEGRPALRMDAGDVTLCADGAYEYLGDLTIRENFTYRRPREETARYAAKWEFDGTRYHLVRLALYPPESEADAREDVCASRSAAEFGTRRWLVSIMPGLTAYQQGASSDAVGGQMRRAGYFFSGPLPGDGTITGPGFSGPGTSERPANLGYPSEAKVAPLGVLSVRGRIGWGWSVEWYTDLSAYEWTGYAQNDTAGGGAGWRALMTHRGIASGLQIGYEWARLRVAAGPALVRSNIRWRATKYPDELHPGSADLNAVGWSAAAAWQQPLSGPVFLELRLQHSFGLTAMRPAIATSAPASVELGRTSVGVFMGVVF